VPYIWPVGSHTKSPIESHVGSHTGSYVEIHVEATRMHGVSAHTGFPRTLTRKVSYR